MTDYVKNTDYAAKDSLISGNPSKLIKGTELGAEFDDIATAIATKADLDSPALVTPDLGTPSAGDLRNCSMAVAPAIGATTPSTGDFTNITATVSTGDAFTITNTGTGNCLVVNDAAGDTTPFVIDAAGRVINGLSASVTGVSSGYQSYGVTVGVGLGGAVYSGTQATSAMLAGYKSANATVGSHSAVSNGDYLLLLRGYGSDGTSFNNAAQIIAACDGTVSSGIVPGRLSFHTADTAGSINEVMRLSSDGSVGFYTSGGTAYMSFSGTNNISTTADIVGGDTNFGISSQGNMYMFIDSDNDGGGHFYVHAGGVGTGTSTEVLAVRNDARVKFSGGQCVALTNGNPTSGATVTLTNATQQYVKTGTGTIATLTVNLPASPLDGQICSIASAAQITALTVASTDGSTVRGGSVGTLSQDRAVEWVYTSATDTWNRRF